jgi:thiol-disulfide isomerase/thioredoxin
MDKIRSLITWSNVANALIVLLGLAVLFVPAVKVFFIGLMMRVGLMRAPTERVTMDHISPVPARISFRSVTDSVFSTDQLKGKILIINFWATWCPPCRAEMPSINELYHHYQNNPKVMVLAVDADGKLPAAQNFMEKNRYDLPVYALAGALPPGLSFESIPTTMVLDGAGRVVARHEGAANYATKGFYEFIDGLVKTSK